MRVRIIAAAVAVILGLAAAGIAVTNMPEIALKRISEEVRRDGPDALEVHLTARALVKYKLAMKARDIPLLRALTGGERGSTFSCELDRMEREGDRAEALLKVSCAGLTRTVRVDMIRRDGVWLICDLKLDLRGSVPRTGGDGYVRG